VFARGRRLVVADAIALMKSCVPYRRRNNLYNIKITDVVQEVGGRMLMLVEGARDKEGRVVLMTLPQNYSPATSPPMNVVRAVMYLLDNDSAAVVREARTEVPHVGTRTADGIHPTRAPAP
jgi:hypothetical protein